jgi:hypothetical protein
MEKELFADSAGRTGRGGQFSLPPAAAVQKGVVYLWSTEYICLMSSSTLLE